MFRTLRFYHSFFKFLSTPSARRATQDQIHHLWRGGHFYPRPPRGGRPQRQGAADRSLYISIHALREESDAGTQRFCGACQISIHALREEGDLGHNVKGLICGISIHALREEGDAAPEHLRRNRRGISIHALREEGDTKESWPILPHGIFLSTPSVRRATAKTERKHPAFVSLYTSLHKLQRDVCKPNRKITPLLAQTAGSPVRSVPENHVYCRFALAGHQKSSTLSWANSGCSPTCSTLVW